MADPTSPGNTPAPAPASPESTGSNKLIVMGVLAVLGIVIAVFLVQNGSDTDDACTLSGTTIGLIGLAIHEGKTAETVAGSAAFSQVCKEVARTAINSPEEPIEATVDLSGVDQTIQYSGTGQELAERFSPAEAPAPTVSTEYVSPAFRRYIECKFAYGIGTVSYNTCMTSAGLQP
jgi:hypothetical protein